MMIIKGNWVGSPDNINYAIWVTDANHLRGGFQETDATTHFAINSHITDVPTIFVNDGLWHHGCITYDGVRVRLYLDGVEVGDGETTSSIPDTSTTALYIGRNAAQNPIETQFYIGDLDEVLVYNRALTAAEISNIYNNNMIPSNGIVYTNKFGTDTVDSSPTDVTFNYSGGAANSNPTLSIGGTISSIIIPDSVIGNTFDDVQGAEIISGDVEYRCFYIKNNNPTTGLNNVKIWISQTTPAINDEIDIGTGTSSKGGTEQTVANENTLPSGVVFIRPVSAATALQIGDLGNSASTNSSKAIWIRRTVSPNAKTYQTDYFVLRMEGTSA